MHDPHPLSPRDIERIGIFRPVHLGDMLCAVPALHSIRGAFPNAHITLIGLPSAQDLLRRFDYVDRVLPFPGFPGLLQQTPQLAALPDFFRDAQACRFDLLLQLCDDGTLSNPLCAALGARRLAGFYPVGGWCPDAERFTPWAERGSEIKRWLRLLQFLDIQPLAEQITFPVLADEHARFAGLAKLHRLQRDHYVCLNPGARRASRRWPPERFAKVGDWLAGQGLAVVIAGTNQEHDIAREVIACMRAPAVDLVGATDTGMFAALIADARLTITNDTGAAQVAAAVRTPSVVVSVGTDPEREAALDLEHHHTLHHPVICRPCAHEACPFGHPCALAVTVAAVLQRARALLHKERSRAVPEELDYVHLRTGHAHARRATQWTHAR
jgi:ADP-heptose:LPS heptosyltransferase